MAKKRFQASGIRAIDFSYTITPRVLKNFFRRLAVRVSPFNLIDFPFSGISASVYSNGTWDFAADHFFCVTSMYNREKEDHDCFITGGHFFQVRFSKGKKFFLKFIVFNMCIFLIQCLIW
jgi:hypothetical protein